MKACPRIPVERSEHCLVEPIAFHLDKWLGQIFNIFMNSLLWEKNIFTCMTKKVKMKKARKFLEFYANPHCLCALLDPLFHRIAQPPNYPWFPGIKILKRF